MRNYRGADYNSGYPLTELTLDHVKKIFKPEFISQLTHGIIFNGNLGDFGLAHDAREIVWYFLDNGVKNIDIKTNGSMRTPDWWASLSHPAVVIGFALDGLEDTHNLYRQDTNWQKIIDNAQAFIKAGGHAMWRFIPFDHNRHQEQACKKLAQQLGFSGFQNIHDGRDHGPVFSRSGDFSHWLGAKQNFEPDLQQMVNSHVTWFDKETTKINNDTPSLTINCYHKIQKELYIAADGTVYPCCFLGFYPGQMTHPGNAQLASLVRENNALEYDLEHCVAWFNSVEETWKHESIKQGRLFQCVSSCAKR
jgi:sulfatase maturation enzyme AslB (radical SAM superfamily)